MAPMCFNLCRTDLIFSRGRGQEHGGGDSDRLHPEDERDWPGQLHQLRQQV
jgi:hypothetical protein